MSIKNLIEAIEDGDSLAIENCFESIMVEKVATALDNKRKQVAKNMFDPETQYDHSIDGKSEDQINAEQSNVVEDGETYDHSINTNINESVISHINEGVVNEGTVIEDGKTYDHSITENIQTKTPTGIKLYHRDKDNNEYYTKHFSGQDAAKEEKRRKKMGHTTVAHSLLYGQNEEGDRINH